MHSICNINYSVPKKFRIAIQNGFKNDYHFIIAELAEEFIKQFSCLEENTKKYITFTVPIEKEVTRIDKNGEKVTKNISHILQFTDSTTFVVNNLSEKIHKIKCKHGHDDEKCKTCGIKYEN